MKPYLLPVLFTLLMSGLSLWVEQGAYTPATLGVPTVQVADYPVGLLTLEERCVDEKKKTVCL